MEEHIPNGFVCAISQEVMRDPVILSDGHTYEKEHIEKWLALGNQTSPLTRERLKDTKLIPNLALKKAIEEWSKRKEEKAAKRNELEKDGLRHRKTNKESSHHSSFNSEAKSQPIIITKEEAIKQIEAFAASLGDGLGQKVSEFAKTLITDHAWKRFGAAGVAGIGYAVLGTEAGAAAAGGLLAGEIGIATAGAAVFALPVAAVAIGVFVGLGILLYFFKKDEVQIEKVLKEKFNLKDIQLDSIDSAFVFYLRVFVHALSRKPDLSGEVVKSLFDQLLTNTPLNEYTKYKYGDEVCRCFNNIITALTNSDKIYEDGMFGNTTLNKNDFKKLLMLLIYCFEDEYLIKNKPVFIGNKKALCFTMSKENKREEGFVSTDSPQKKSGCPCLVS